MASRVQGKRMGVGKAAQADISTPSGSFLTFTQLNHKIASPMLRTENDATWIGKGNEFASQVFKVSNDAGDQIQEYGSTEITTWAWCYGLGNSAVTGSGPYSYTATPLTPASGLELLYFSVCEQVPDVGGNSVDNLFVGCQLAEVTNEIRYGAGLQTHTCNFSWVGSGLVTSPSGITLPSLTIQHEQLSSSLTATINGTDYVANKDILRVTMGWNNAPDLNIGLFPGSGQQNGASVRGRIFIGRRVPTLSFDALLVYGSPEYNALVNQTTGTATFKVSYDTNDWCQWAWEQISYGVVENGSTGDYVSVTVTIIPQFNSSTGLLTFTSSCAIGGIA
jgi:hypothetical protein